MYSYKITKFNPAWTTEILKQEWTSISEIKTDQEREDYITTENAYIKTVQDICLYYKIEELRIVDLEKYSMPLDYEKGQILKFKDIPQIVRAILREEMWSKLLWEDCEFHFGYDFYMYFVSRKAPIDKAIIDGNLYLEEFTSPYL